MIIQLCFNTFFSFLILKNMLLFNNKKSVDNSKKKEIFYPEQLNIDLVIIQIFYKKKTNAH